MSTIALVLPAFKLEKVIQHSLRNVQAGTAEFSDHNFILYPIDDGSPDDTFAEIQRCGEEYGLVMRAYRNEQNLGLVQTLRKAYGRVLGDRQIEYILKTDLDADFDQRIVLRRMVPYIDRAAKIVVGTRVRPIKEEENPYEYRRQNDVFRIMKNEFGLADIDPPSAGSQLYQTSFLPTLMAHPVVQSYNKRWGFDFLLPLVARSLEVDVPVVQIECGHYDPERRPQSKVQQQYDTYIEIIAGLQGKKPGELSGLYQK